MPFIVILSPFKRFPFKTGAFMICSMFISWMKWITILYFCAMSTHCVFKTRMLVSAAACAPDNRALNKISSATVSFFIDHVYTNFSCMKITSPTRINGKT